jgi:hypothetical protein
MVLTVSFVLSPVIGLSCHRHPSDMACPRPVGPTSPPLDLTPASRRQDHTTSPSASNIVRQHAADCSQAVRRPALPPRVTPDAAASTAFHPAFRDDHDTPLLWGGMARICRDDLPDGESEIFLQRGLDRRANQWTATRTHCPRVPDAVQRSPGDAKHRSGCAAPQSRDPYRHQRRGPRISSAPRQSRFSPVMIAP